MRGMRALTALGVVIIAGAGLLALSSPEVPALPPPVTLRAPSPGHGGELDSLIVSPEPVFEDGDEEAGGAVIPVDGEEAGQDEPSSPAEGADDVGDDEDGEDGDDGDDNGNDDDDGWDEPEDDSGEGGGPDPTDTADSADSADSPDD